MKITDFLRKQTDAGSIKNLTERTAERRARAQNNINKLSNSMKQEQIQTSQDKSQWVDIGVKDVQVDKIDASDMTHVKSVDDFKKVSYDEMVNGFEKLNSTVRPSVENGADGDYFRQLDKQKKLDYADGYLKIYDAFYGDSAIRLEKNNDKYTVVNGAHRLFVAHQLNITDVPARVIERQNIDDKN